MFIIKRKCFIALETADSALFQISYIKARGDEVQMVIIDGDVFEENRVVLSVDEQKIVADANEAGRRISHELSKKGWSLYLFLAR